MTDRATRRARRSGLAILERMRADEIPAYTTAREVTCLACLWEPSFNGEAPHTVCELCDEQGRVSYDPLDAVRTLAFCRVEEARELSPTADPGAYLLWDNWPLEAWASSLRDLAAKLPPKRVEVARKHRKPCRYAPFPVGEFAQCDCRLLPSKVAHDVPAEQWLLSVAALSAAQECWKKEFNKVNAQGGARKIYEALSACQSWNKRPTPEQRQSVGDTRRDFMPQWIWLLCEAIYDGRAPIQALQAAAVTLEPERVRELASAAVVGAVL